MPLAMTMCVCVWFVAIFQAMFHAATGRGRWNALPRSTERRLALGVLEYADGPGDRFRRVDPRRRIVGRVGPEFDSRGRREGRKPVDHATTDDFAYGDKGRVEWVVRDPTHTQYDIHFRVVPKRPPLEPQSYVPPIGVGDLLRYNAGVPRPIACPFAAGLVDLRGTGRADLVGCWNYAYRPGDPWDGIICYPRVGAAEQFEFGDLAPPAVRRQAGRNGTEALLAHLHGVRLRRFQPRRPRRSRLDAEADPGPPTSTSTPGDRDAGGLPIFTPAGSVPVSGWEACPRGRSQRRRRVRSGRQRAVHQEPQSGRLAVQARQAGAARRGAGAVLCRSRRRRPARRRVSVREDAADDCRAREWFRPSWTRFASAGGETSAATRRSSPRNSRLPGVDVTCCTFGRRGP